MPDDLERERAHLLQRLHALERDHQTLHEPPYDQRAHEAHLDALLVYQAEVRAYRKRLTERWKPR
jgi:hypothetical protein